MPLRVRVHECNRLALVWSPHRVPCTVFAAHKQPLAGLYTPVSPTGMRWCLTAGFFLAFIV